MDPFVCDQYGDNLAHQICSHWEYCDINGKLKLIRYFYNKYNILFDSRDKHNCIPFTILFK